MSPNRPVAILASVLCVSAATGAEPRVSNSPHWSFAPIARPVVAIEDEQPGMNSIDGFVNRRLRAVRLAASAEADPTTLIRRVTLDLTGLPPHPSDVDAFLQDTRPDRYERLVDRLLASPHYGERWAVPWLDLCHYADTDGYLTDQLRPVAWRYRSWLVNALNENLPFDQFTIQQLAGDLLPAGSIKQRLATGFLRQTLSNREGGAEPEEFRVKQVIDRTEMVGAIWLGLTVGCARCHDHKYDDLAQREFFELYACLNNADEVNIDAPLAHEREAFQSSRAAYWNRRGELLDPLQSDVARLQREWERRCLNARDNPGQDHIWDRQWELLGLVWGGGLGEGQLEGQEIVKLPQTERTRRQQADLLDYFVRSGSVVDPEAFKRLKISDLSAALRELKGELPPATRAPVMQAAMTTRANYIHESGDFRDRGDNVLAAVPDCLPDWPAAEVDSRLRLAQWLVTPQNPLPARVTMNRVWEQFFGRGLVETTEDFGVRGASPSHPQLLDWLAAEFIESGWNMKHMHRLIVCSATYRRSSQFRQDVFRSDPENKWLSRQNALRISAEMIRDSGLAASGLLYRKMSGPPVRPRQSPRVVAEGFGNHSWKTSPQPDCYRRGLYTFRIRTTPFAQGIIFDAPNPNEICTRRPRSNTPLQALTLLNDPVFFEFAQGLADRTLLLPGGDDERVNAAFRFCLSRPPSTDETKSLLKFLRVTRAAADSTESLPKLDHSFVSNSSPVERVAWTELCSVILNLHEFLTRE